MRLTKLEISGFKSFATKTDLTFTSPVTSIVGPNGSGKSNIAEAFRFVLGEQSIKSLRGKRGEDLIFNGSPRQRRANRASARVVFDNRDRFLNVDFDDVVIERIVHRDGANEYRLNGSPVRLRDVMELLAGANIGASSHHIISQGEADKMLEAKPVDRREIIEDALGLKVYHYKIRESQKKLEKTQKNIEETQTLRREIAPRIQQLKREVEKIEAARKIREDLHERYQEYLKREQLYLDDSWQYVRARLDELQHEKEQLEERVADARHHIESASSADTYKHEIQQRRTERDDLRRRRDEMVRSLGTLEGQISSHERTIERHTKEQNDDTRSVSISTVRSFIDELTGHIDHVLSSDNMDEVRQALVDTRDALTSFAREPKDEGPSPAVSDARNEIERLQNERQRAQQEVNDLQNEEERISRRIHELEEERERSLEAVRDYEKQLHEYQRELQTAEAEVQRLEERKDRLGRERERFQSELRDAGMLIGAQVLRYESYEPHDERGAALPRDDVVNEPREHQEQRLREIEKRKMRLEDMEVENYEEITHEYQELVERDEFLAGELADLQASADKLTTLIDDLRQSLHSEFESGIEKINEQFQHFFSLMFGGGQAWLRPVEIEKRRKNGGDDESEIEQGVEVDVHMAQKNIKGLQMLSGGERTLTSLALLFALTQVQAPPFIILDETDAALDEANSKRYGDLIEYLSHHSQLILVTHNRETMAHAGVLYGVTMGRDGVSKILSIKFEEAKEQAMSA